MVHFYLEFVAETLAGVCFGPTLSPDKVWAANSKTVEVVHCTVSPLQTLLCPQAKWRHEDICEHAIELNRNGDVMPVVIIWHDGTSIKPKLTELRRGAGGNEHARLRSSACRRSGFESLKREASKGDFTHTYTHTHSPFIRLWP